MMILKTILNQHLGPNVANELEKLLTDYQAIQTLPWLISAIEPLAQELRAKLNELKQVEGAARPTAKQAQAEADEAVNAALQAGERVSLTATEKRIQTAQVAAQKGQELSNLIGDLRRTRERLEKVEQLLAALEGIVPPPQESIREIVLQRLG